MNKNFERGSVHKQSDYNKESNSDLIITALVCIGLMAFFVLKLANII
jgi:hypothetical protein